MNVTTNGRARKSLADQIDRLDKVLAGLAEGLHQVIASTVEQAVRAALKEVLAQQDLGAKLKAETTAPALKPTLSAQVASVCGQAWGRVRGLSGTAATCAAKVAEVVVRTATSIHATCKYAGPAGLCLLRRVATSSAAVFAFGVEVGMAAAFIAVWVMAVASGIEAWRRLRQPLARLFRFG